MNALLQKFSALPRAFKWLIFAAVFILAYFAVIDPILGVAQGWDNRAQMLRTALVRDKELASDEGDGRAIEQAQSIYGKPHMPGSGQTTPESLYRLVDSILQGNLVADRSISESSVPLTGDAAAAMKVGTITRVILDVSFESDSATAIAVLSDLERSSNVSAVGRVRLDKTGLRAGNSADDNSDLVRARLSVEAWIISSGAGAGGVGGAGSGGGGITQ